MSSGGLKSIIGAVLLIVLAAACGPRDKPIPSEPKARSEFLSGAAANLNVDERNMLNRFLSRLDAQNAAGGKVVEVSLPRAIDLERAYEAQIAETQLSLKKLQEDAKSVLDVVVIEPTVIRDEKAQPPTEKALRFVVNIANRGTRTVENLSLRVEVRDPSGKYLAVIPSLEVNGTLHPGDLGRLMQKLPLDAQRHRYILDGKPVRITAYPIRVAYDGGEVLEPGKELQALETLHRTRID